MARSDFAIAADLAAEAGHFATAATNADLAGDHEQADAIRESLNDPMEPAYLSPQEIRMAALDMASKFAASPNHQARYGDILTIADAYATYITSGKRPTDR